MNQPLKQTVIYLADRQPEVVNTQRFTPQAIDQVNRAAALIEGVENRENGPNDEWEGDDTREDFIAFSSLLARNFNNPVLTPEYLNYMKEKIKRNAVVIDQNFEEYLRNTYNTIKDMFITQGFNG